MHIATLSANTIIIGNKMHEIQIGLSQNYQLPAREPSNIPFPTFPQLAIFLNLAIQRDICTKPWILNFSSKTYYQKWCLSCSLISKRKKKQRVFNVYLQISEVVISFPVHHYETKNIQRPVLRKDAHDIGIIYNRIFSYMALKDLICFLPFC